MIHSVDRVHKGAPAKKRALVVTDCGLYWPSGMVRALQFEPLFRESTVWTAEYTTRHSEPLTHLLAPLAVPGRLRRTVVGAFRRPLTAYSTRWDSRREDEIVERAADFDVVHMVKTRGAGLYRKLYKLARPRVVIDLNDAVWIPGASFDLQEILPGAAAVICENQAVADFATQFNSRISIVEDSPQIEAFDKVRHSVRRDPSVVTLGWIGGAYNIGHLYKILEPLEAIAKTYPNIHLRIVGVPESRVPHFENVKFSCRESFNQQEMIAEVLAFDIGLFPLFRNEDGRARGTLKAKVYMSGGAAAICENYGENPRLVQDGFNGYLAASPDEWYQKLEHLIADPSARAAMAAQGLATIRTKYTAPAVFSQIVAAFDSAVESAPQLLNLK